MAGPARTPAPPLEIAPPRTLFVTGKGGVGKSTVAAALAHAFSQAGARTLLVELAGHEGAAALLSPRRIGYEPTAIGRGAWALRIDPETSLREYAGMQLRVQRLADVLVGNPMFRQFATAAPGFRELLLLGKIWELAHQHTRGRRTYEAIVVDAPATGHGLGLLGMAGTIARAFPVGPVATQSRTIDEWVRSPEHLAAVVVTLPEEVPVTETLELYTRLEAEGVNVAEIVVNGLLPERFNEQQREWIAEVTDPVPAVRVAADELERRELQLAQVERLVETVGVAALLPLVFRATVETTDVHDLARRLSRPQRHAAPTLEEVGR